MGEKSLIELVEEGRRGRISQHEGIMARYDRYELPYKAQEWFDSVNSFAKKMEKDFNSRQVELGPQPDMMRYQKSITEDLEKLQKNVVYAQRYANQIQDEGKRSEYLKAIADTKAGLDSFNASIQNNGDYWGGLMTLAIEKENNPAYYKPDELETKIKEMEAKRDEELRKQEQKLKDSNVGGWLTNLFASDAQKKNLSDEVMILEEKIDRFKQYQKMLREQNKFAGLTEATTSKTADTTGGSLSSDEEKLPSAYSVFPASFESIRQLEDFVEKSQYHSDKSDLEKRFDFDNKAYHYLNQNDYWGEGWLADRMSDLDAAISSGNDALSYMNKDEIALYNYFINTGDKKTAKKYLSSIYNELKKRKTEGVAADIAESDGLEKTLKSSGLSLLSGMASANTGLMQFLDNVTGSDEVREKNWLEDSYAQLRPQLSGGNAVMADVLNATGNMANSMVVGAINPFLGAALTGVQSTGNLYNDAIQAGYSVEEAKLYSAVGGVLEGGLQYILGGISTLGKGGASKLLGKIPVLQKLGKLAPKIIKSPVMQKVLKTMGSYIARMGDEGFEEYLQAVIDPMVRNLILKEDNELDLLSDDALYAAFLGALTAGILNLPSAVTGGMNGGNVENQSLQNPFENGRMGLEGSDGYGGRQTVGGTQGGHSEVYRIPDGRTQGTQALNRGGTPEGARTYREDAQSFQRRASEAVQGGPGRRLERHGTGQIAYLPAQQVAVESEAGKAEQGLRKLGASVVVTEGNFETNRNDLTTRHIDAVTAPGGTIYISNQTQIPAELIVAHEGLHFLQRQNSPLYDNFYDTILANIDFNSNVYDEVAGQINDEHFGGSLDIRSPDAVQSIFTELTAYIHQWLTVDPEHAKNTFEGMFRDWDAVVEASRALREAMDRGVQTEGSGEYGGEKNFLGGYFRRGKQSVGQRPGISEEISGNDTRSQRETIETPGGRAEFEAVQERNLSKKQKRDSKIADRYGYDLYHVPYGSTMTFDGESRVMEQTAFIRSGFDAVFALDGTDADYIHHELFHQFMRKNQHGEMRLLDSVERRIDYDSDNWYRYSKGCQKQYGDSYNLDIVYEEITGDLCEYAMSGSETMRNRLEGLFEPGTLNALCKEARRVFAANRTGKQVGEGSSQNQPSSDRNPRYYLEKTGERNVNNIHNASQEKAKPLSAEAVVNTEKGQARQTTVQGIAKVTDGEVEVKLREGKTAPLADVEFTNPTLGSLYEAAGNYVTGTAKAFVAGYDGSLPLTQYQAAFEFIHNQAVKGVAMDAAVEAAGDVGQRLSNSARKLAYNSGLRDAQVLHSPADNGRIEAENVIELVPDKQLSADMGAEQVLDNFEESAQMDLSEEGDRAGFKYKHNPSDNPKVLKDVYEDSSAIYGYRPRKDGSLSAFADGNWSDADYVEYARKNRIEYHNRNESAIMKLVSEMRSQGRNNEQIARAVSKYRNQSRLNAYLDADGNILDQVGYEQALLHSKSYDDLIKEGKTNEDIIESATRGNPGMDACTGLYDVYYTTYMGGE